MPSYDDPTTFRGQLQRGRGVAARRAPSAPHADDAVYECVINDPRWDRQTETRGTYLAGLVQKLGLQLTPLESHLVAYDDDDPWDIGLLLHVLALLTSAGREDAAAVMRRYVTAGKHWSAALNALAFADSRDIHVRWAQRGEFTQHSRSRLDVLLDEPGRVIHFGEDAFHASIHPETVALAGLLASPCWRNLAEKPLGEQTAQFYAGAARRIRFPGYNLYYAIQRHHERDRSPGRAPRPCWRWHKQRQSTRPPLRPWPPRSSNGIWNRLQRPRTFQLRSPVRPSTSSRRSGSFGPCH
jgi:hypothetical protein